MPAPATLSTRQRRALAAMGIDLWIRRAPANSTPANSTPADSVPAQVAAPAVVRPAITVSMDARPPPQALPYAPPVELECLAAPGGVVLGAFASAADRRFAQDVLLAVAGATAAVARTHFRWPQTQTGDVSPSAARSAFGGFLRGQTQRTGARCLMLFGSAATALLDPAFSQGGCSVLTLPDAATLRGDAARKKALWLTISHLAQR
jgi:hypothetical protein